MPEWASADFRTVRWYGKWHNFSPTQAAVVKKLWEARKDGSNYVKDEDLISAADSHAARLRDIFRPNNGYHPAWKTMIVRDRTPKGYYRLQGPPLTQPVSQPSS